MTALLEHVLWWLDWQTRPRATHGARRSDARPRGAAIARPATGGFALGAHAAAGRAVSRERGDHLSYPP